MTYDKEPRAFAGWNRDEYIRLKSSSGGLFTALAEYVLEQSGVVCGCVLNSELKAVHVIAERLEDLDAMRGSKYVQSSKQDAFRKIIGFLKADRKVLFVGTPCECAGLKELVAHSIVAFNRQNLYLCEFICHGVPSPSVFRAYIDNINKKNNSLITKFKFRCKDHGWNQSGLQLGVEYETNQNQHKRIFPAFMDEYMCGFLEDIFLRPSCYDCKFKRIPKKTCDITIADFWGIDSVDKSFNDGKGTSLVLVHGEHGQQLLDAAQGRLYLHEVDYHKAIRKNPPLLKSAKLSEERRAFFSELRSKGYSKVSKKYMNTHKWLFSTAWRILGNIIEKIVFTVLALIGIKATEKKLTTIRQFIQFCIVGVSNALVSYVINIITLTLQRPLGFRYDYMVANVTAFVLSVLWSYHWNNRYVFAEGADKRSRKKTLLKAYATYAFSGIVLNNTLSTLWIRVIGFSKYLAPLLNIPFSMPVNFLISKFWTYREKREIK